MTIQTLDRAMSLLRLLAASGFGERLVDLQRTTGLTKPTIHRILASLQQHGMIRRDATTRRYRLGPEISVLGWAAGHQAYDLRDLSQVHVVEVAQRTGDTCFLTVRSGYDTICLDRQSGAYPVKAFTVEIGTRRPLGVGAGGVVLLASLEPPEVDSILAALEAPLADYPNATPAALARAIGDARRSGHAVSNGLVLDGVRGIAVPVRDGAGQVVAALSVAAIRSRIPDPRVPEMLATLRTHASLIEGRIRRREVALGGGAPAGRARPRPPVAPYADEPDRPSPRRDPRPRPARRPAGDR